MLCLCCGFLGSCVGGWFFRRGLNNNLLTHLAVGLFANNTALYSLYVFPPFGPLFFLPPRLSFSWIAGWESMEWQKDVGVVNAFQRLISVYLLFWGICYCSVLRAGWDSFFVYISPLGLHFVWQLIFLHLRVMSLLWFFGVLCGGWFFCRDLNNNQLTELAVDLFANNTALKELYVIPPSSPLFFPPHRLSSSWVFGWGGMEWQKEGGSCVRYKG